MKTIYEHDLGGDGAKAGAYIDEKNVTVSVSYPIVKVIAPAMVVIDNLIDKIEKLVPGDQTGIAAKLKAEAQAELAQLIGSVV